MINKMNILVLKRVVFSFLSILLFFGVTDAAQLSFYPTDGSIGKNCVVGFDIVLDSDGHEILGADLLIESSMEFVDFVPSGLFSHTIPPIIKDNGFIKIGLFSFPEDIKYTTGSIGKIYLKDTSFNYDSYLKFVVYGNGNTVDTNLFDTGINDILTFVNNGTYILDGEECSHDMIITGGFIGQTYEESLNNLKDELEKDWIKKNLIQFFSNKIFIGGVLLLAFIILFFLIKSRGSKRTK